MERQQVTTSTQRDHHSEMHQPAKPAVPVPASVHPLSHLHQQFGNRTVARLLQAKLKVSQPGDAFEQEADQVADHVMRMPDPVAGSRTPLASTAQATGIQRMCEACEDQRHESPDEQKATGMVQAKAEAGASPQGEAGVEAAMSGLGGGAPLSPTVRQFFEPRFGHDFSQVRVHTDAEASASARSVNALAYTVGRDVVFGAGQYAPETAAGQHLLAHELAHVVQQGRTEPQIQRLTITQHALTKGTCDERNIEWIFSLDKPAPDDGYIVQKVERNEMENRCPTVNYGPPGPLPTFWEAWFVKKGDKLDWLASTMAFTDSSVHAARPNTNGSYIVVGTVKFFTKSTTGDLGRDNIAPADPKSAWGPGKVPISGALPSTPTEPSWWSSAPVEGPKERGVWSSWNCCDADSKKHYYELKSKP
ncbi:MAG TPA: DUF4157 domain-containing protein [Blastocatellia bacterium]|nr:DUF4157 domain-containing protein [Blastocatellia bacterium]